MGPFFGFVFGLWFLVAFLSAPYFWAKKTDRSQAPIVRRFTAVAYGLTWPYLVYKMIASRQQRESRTAAHSAAEDRILGDAKPIMPNQAPAARPKIENPFDNR